MLKAFMELIVTNTPVITGIIEAGKALIIEPQAVRKFMYAFCWFELHLCRAFSMNDQEILFAVAQDKHALILMC